MSERYIEPTPEQEAQWRQWVAERPDNVRVVAERFEPWTLYRMKSTGHRVIVRSFDEEEGGGVTVRVVVSGRFNLVTFERAVFGVNPDDLTPCDPPAPEELVGAVLTDRSDIDAYVETARRDLP